MTHSAVFPPAMRARIGACWRINCDQALEAKTVGNDTGNAIVQAIALWLVAEGRLEEAQSEERAIAVGVFVSAVIGRYVGQLDELARVLKEIEGAALSGALFATRPAKPEPEPAQIAATPAKGPEHIRRVTIQQKPAKPARPQQQSLL